MNLASRMRPRWWNHLEFGMRTVFANLLQMMCHLFAICSKRTLWVGANAKNQPHKEDSMELFARNQKTKNKKLRREWACNLPHQVSEAKRWKKTITLKLIFCGWSWINHDVSKELNEICLFVVSVLLCGFCVHTLSSTLLQMDLHITSTHVYLYTEFGIWLAAQRKNSEKPKEKNHIKNDSSQPKIIQWHINCWMKQKKTKNEQKTTK